MSSSGYSKLVYGTTITFKTHKYEQVFKRFDSKTGKPYELKSPAFSIEAYSKDDVFLAKLPADTLALAEETTSYESAEWNRRRKWQRINDWFLSLGIAANDCDKLNLFGFFFGPYGENHSSFSSAVIGAIVATGSSYSRKSVIIDENAIITAKSVVATGFCAANLPNWGKYAELQLHTNCS